MAVFGQSLAAKSLLVFLTRDSLWRHIQIEKYIAPLSIVDWVRKVNKNLPNASSQSKMLVHMFPLIGKRLTWKVGSRLQVRTGSDAIVGCRFGQDPTLQWVAVMMFYCLGALLTILGILGEVHFKGLLILNRLQCGGKDS